MPESEVKGAMRRVGRTRAVGGKEMELYSGGILMNISII